MSPAWMRWTGVVLWSGALAAALLAIDRVVVGFPAPAGWQEVEALHGIPAALGPPVVPAYLPDRLEWPPRHSFYRLDQVPGVWFGLRSRADGEPALWIGMHAWDPPEALGAPRACVPPELRAVCPQGWVLLTRPDHDGRPLFVLTRLSRLQAQRILGGLTRVR